MNKQFNELLQAYAIGCLKEENNKKFNQFLKSADTDFLQELGEYQNLIALLPSINDIEVPPEELKIKLMDLLSKRLSNLDIVLGKQNESKSIPAEKIIIKEEPIKIPKKENVKKENIKTEINQEVSTEKKVDVQENNIPVDDKIKDFKPLKQKSPGFVVVKDSDTLLEESFFTKEQKTIKFNKGWLAAIIFSILFIISAVILFIIYYNFNSQINNQKKQIDDLKSQLLVKNATQQEISEFSSFVESPDFKLVPLIKSSNEYTGNCKVLSSAAKGASYLYVSNLPILNGNEVYKLWIGKKRTYNPILTFKATKNEQYLNLNLSELPKGEFIILTVEEKPEVETPGSKTIMWGEIN